MLALEQKILNEGTVLEGHVLKVGSFLNQQLDVDFLVEMGKEIDRIYKNDGVTKLLTVESSGIAVAVAAGTVMHLPVVFAKKNKTSNISGEIYSAMVHSYTHNIDYKIVVSKDYLSVGDRVVIIDDLIATGGTIEAIIKLVEQLGGEVVKIAFLMELEGLNGREKLAGYAVDSVIKYPGK